ncbi:HNH endonuclease [Mycobacterium phage MyraDee]|uniref:HNH endonuclease n=1 Tax=Mycobacterium phage MyraDee TaxID=2024303 RepID=A0A222YXV9_9CAUD|nr:HNH endonuclease [Mycobacterium phage MyraDee]ASR77109.1 HNH endonuclease [Mycobacterium phage MyraDee]
MWTSSNRSKDLPSDWEDRRSRVLRAAEWICEIGIDGCLIKATDVDHIRRGNDHSIGNLRAACSWCHDRKSSAEGHARKRELRARRRRPTERHPGSL